MCIINSTFISTTFIYMAPIALGPDIGGRIPIVFERLSWRKRERKRQRCRLFCLAGIYSSSLAKCSLSFSVSLLSTVRRLRRPRQANTAQTACRPNRIWSGQISVLKSNAYYAPHRHTDQVARPEVLFRIGSSRLFTEHSLAKTLQ